MRFVCVYNVKKKIFTYTHSTGLFVLKNAVLRAVKYDYTKNIHFISFRLFNHRITISLSLLSTCTLYLIHCYIMNI